MVEFGRHKSMDQDLGGIRGKEFPYPGDIAQMIRG